MPNAEHLAMLKRGVKTWNEWRASNPYVTPNLQGAKLSWLNLAQADLSWSNLAGADLHEADLRKANLHEANLHEANMGGVFLSDAYLSLADLSDTELSGADLLKANLSGADLSEADLHWANLSWADLSGATLVRTNLKEADFRSADLSGADLTEADLSDSYLWNTNFCWAILTDANLSTSALAATVFGSTSLINVKGLESCLHTGPSILDIRTLQKSGMLPLPFLQGCGLSKVLIKKLPSLLNHHVQYSSCFISYSAKDEEFAIKLHDELQDKGVRCWFAPEDMKIGDRIRNAIDDALLTHDKLIIVLSEASVDSAWLSLEVETAFEEEDRHNQKVFYPIMLDNSLDDVNEPWADEIRNSHPIIDFSQWRKSESAFRKAFRNLLDQLKVED